MAKGQMRSNKEVKKPKKEKAAPAPAPLFEKGVSGGAAPVKKK